MFVDDKHVFSDRFSVDFEILLRRQSSRLTVIYLIHMELDRLHMYSLNT